MSVISEPASSWEKFLLGIFWDALCVLCVSPPRLSHGPPAPPGGPVTRGVTEVSPEPAEIPLVSHPHGPERREGTRRDSSWGHSTGVALGTKSFLGWQ